MELQVRILASQLLPELPDLKICVAGRRVVEQHDPSGSNLGKPVLEVVPDGVVGVRPVDVQQIHGAVSELLLRLVESRAQESGERPVVPLVVSVDLGEHGLVVMARMRIALPRVDRIALARHAVLLNRLAHPEVGLAVVRSELDHQGRPQAGDQVVHERQMTGPVAEVTGAIPSRIECPGGQERKVRTVGSRCRQGMPAPSKAVTFGKASRFGLTSRPRGTPSPCLGM